MHESWKAFLLIAMAGAFGLLAAAQDSQPLGDVARQARQQKQSQAQIENGKGAKAAKVITNEEIPSRPDSASDAGVADRGRGGSEATAASSGGKLPAGQWKSQIEAEKNTIQTLAANIDKLNTSIQFAPANCVSGCVQWNERQKQKQQDVEQMRTQLETEKRHLQDMQESARQQGYGSSVYDP